MPVPVLISELSLVAASNFPAGSDSPASLDDTQRAHASFIAQLRDGKAEQGGIQAQSYTAVTTVGTSTAYVVATLPVQPALVSGQRYRIKLHTANGASPTLTRDGLAAKAVIVYNSAGAKVAPAAAGLPTLFDVEYDGTDYVVLNPLPPVFVDGSGNVGIGTSSPTVRLSVSKDGGAGDAGQFVRITDTNTANSVGPTSLTIGMMNHFASGPRMAIAGTTGLSFCVGDGSDLAAQRKVDIDSSGNLLVGQTTTATPPTSTALTFGGGLRMNPNNFTAGNAANTFWEPGTGQFWRSTSSLRYKKNVQNYSNGLEKLANLRPVTYNSANGPEPEKVFAGFIAEEVNDAGLIEFVEFDAEGRPDSLAYANMVSLLTVAIQELKAIIDTQATRITALEAK